MTDRIIIIGAGHNGLACAAYLAKAGRDVLVLEAAEQVGGASASRQLAPGFQVSAVAHLAHQLNPAVLQELQLENHGLRFASSDIGAVALGDEGHLFLSGNRVSGAVSDDDAKAFGEFHDQMVRFKQVLEHLYNAKPPRLNGSRDELWPLVKFGWQLKRMGRKHMQEFLRIAGTNIFDILDEHFDGDLIKGAISLDAVQGNHLGSRSANTIYTYLHRMTGTDCCLPVGGMGAFSAALKAAAEAAGAEIATGRTVDEILLDHGKVVGVRVNGDPLEAGAVISSADPKTTFLELLGAQNLEADFAKRIDNLRMRGNAAKLHLALNALPDFEGLTSDQLNQRLLIAPSAAKVDRAYDYAKYGEYSQEPVMEICLPSVVDGSLAPEGKHVLSAVVQYAPYHLKAGWSEGKAAFLDLTLKQIERFAPQIRGLIEHAELLTPLDLESEYRLKGGHWHHGELALDAFLMLRPVPGAARYSSPVSGLYLCGAGSHPGGGVMGSAGRNAANVILQESRHVG